MKNKLLFIILILLLVLCFTGCAQVDFTYAYTKNGRYQQIIDVWLDKDISASSNYTNAEARAKIIEIFNSEGYTVITDDDEPDHIRGYKNFISQEEMSKDALGSGLINSATENNNGFWFNYSNTKSSTIFDAGFMISLMWSIRSNYGISITDFSLLDLYNLKTSYNYLVPFKSVTSDADEITKQGDYYKHKWIMSDRESSNVNFTIRTPRKAIWYSVAIFSAVITLIVAGVVNIIKNKHNGRAE